MFKAYCVFMIWILIIISCSTNRSNANTQDATQVIEEYTHPIPYSPSHYVAYYASEPVVIDGQLDDEAWKEIPWTEDFVDIEGELRPLATWQTKAKMCWTDDHFIIAADIKEPHVWATLTERDAIMYHDDDFEVFIDPDADGHHYFEFEMNAFNAIWDLYMLYPYGIDNGRNYIMNWDIRDIETAVHVNGTLNDPSDEDESWSVEIAIPWTTFKDFKSGNPIPQNGEQWRVNFSRVDWTMEINDGQYVKKKNRDGNVLPEDNWVWSPTGYVNMHKPETWGFVQFETDMSQEFKQKPDEKIKWALWQTYYALKDCRKFNVSNCSLPEKYIKNIGIADYVYAPTLEIYDGGFIITADDIGEGYYSLDHRAQIKYYKSRDVYDLNN